MKKLLLLTAALVMGTMIFAYPITPAPLRKLIMESQLIIRGKAIEVGKSAGKDVDTWERDFAIVEVTQVLQGTTGQKRIKVYFCSGMVCPAPGVFYKDEETIAFLRPREKKDGYQVESLSYGVKHDLDEEGFKAYTDRIGEMQALLKLKKGPEQEEKILAWLIKCAETRATRWEGTYELSAYSDRKRKDIYLATDQRNRLYNALMKQDHIDDGDLALADIVRGINDEALLNLLKKSLHQLDSSHTWSANGYMFRIAALTGDKDLLETNKQFNQVIFSFDKENEKATLYFLNLFKEQMEKTKLKQPD